MAKRKPFVSSTKARNEKQREKELFLKRQKRKNSEENFRKTLEQAFVLLIVSELNK